MILLRPLFYLEMITQVCNKLAIKFHESIFKTVDEILLLHREDIVKFDHDILGINLCSHTNVDSWMHYVTNKEGTNSTELQIN